MSALFKGPWLHWCALTVGIGILAVAGYRGLHVREFSIFLFVVCSVSLALVLLVALPSRPKE